MSATGNRLLLESATTTSLCRSTDALPILLIRINARTNRSVFEHTATFRSSERKVSRVPIRYVSHQEETAYENACTPAARKSAADGHDYNRFLCGWRITAADLLARALQVILRLIRF